MAPDSAGHRFILASASPRRLELLRQIGLTPDKVFPADIDETVRGKEPPTAYARRMAAEKSRSVARSYPNAIVLGADTVVACGARILPKAEDEATARECLGMLSGRRHRVIGGICVIAPDGRERQRVVTTTVKFMRLTPNEVDRYIATAEWNGKAGGYAIQGDAAKFVVLLSGSYSNVVGLPLHETYRLVTAAKK